MPSAEFLLTVLVLELTPGPNMTTLAVLALARGRRAGLAAVLGVALGLGAHAVAVGLGAGLAVARYPWLYDGLRWAGVLYLLWIALEGWRAAGDAAPGGAAEEAGDERGLVGRWFLLNLLNPKSVLFFLVIVPRFIAPNGPPPWAQTVALGAVFVAIATAIHAAIVLLAARVGPALARGGGTVLLRKGLSLALVAIAAWLAWETRR